MMFALAVIFKWEHMIIDVKNSLVNADLEEEIYISQPLGFITGGKLGRVYRLEKAENGSPQAF